MPPKVKEIFFPVKDEEQWNQIIGPDNKKVTFIDLYYPWFGRCEVLDESLRSLYLTIDDADKKMQFFNVDLAKIPAAKEQLKEGEKQGVDHNKPTAKPRFLVYLV
ncbi:MAG: hypothetical protein P4M11_08055 [Candidatus Pacebacteria bacterium]|nr:hypothetical protein [Candidatus Paceibacterota bacterium]